MPTWGHGVERTPPASTTNRWRPRSLSIDCAKLNVDCWLFDMCVCWLKFGKAIFNLTFFSLVYKGEIEICITFFAGVTVSVLFSWCGPLLVSWAVPDKFV